MPDQYLHCPACERTEWVSDEDPDASFSLMLSHIRTRHPEQDQTPTVLWPRIEVSGG